jgi:hypothetical protein
VSERQDLNGDGDLLDLEASRLDLATGARALIGPGRLRPEGGRLLLVHREWEAQSDVNGDGDASDEFVHLYDADSFALEPLAVVNTRNRSWNVSGDTLFSTPSERDLRADLNGDGDRADTVLHALDLELRRSFNLRRASSSGFFPHGPWIFGVLSEALAGRDWNSDGDATDSLLHSYDEARHVLSLHPFEAPDVVLRLAHEDRVLTTHDELVGDANGDGDELDRHPVLYDLRQRTTKPIPLALAQEPVLFSTDYSPIWMLGEHLAFLVGEREQGMDRNGDGDLDDDVLQVYDTATSRTSSTGLALFHFSGDEGTWNAWPGPAHLTLAVSEPNQGGLDLNGDGDARDHVLHVLSFDRAGRQRTVNLRSDVDFQRVQLEVQPRARWIALQEDLDGDDPPTHAHALRFHHVASGATLTLEGADLLALGEDHALVRVLEGPLGDRNGDGDLLDTVLERVTLLGP